MSHSDSEVATYSICMPILSHSEEETMREVFDTTNPAPPVVGVLIVVIEAEAVADSAGATAATTAGHSQSLKAKVALLTKLCQEHSSTLAAALAFEDCKNMEHSLSRREEESQRVGNHVDEEASAHSASSAKSIQSNEAVSSQCPEASIASGEEEKKKISRVKDLPSVHKNRDDCHHHHRHHHSCGSSRNKVIREESFLDFRKGKDGKMSIKLIGRTGRASELTRGFLSDSAPRSCTWVPEISAATVAPNEHAR